MQDKCGYVWLLLSGIGEIEQNHGLQVELCHKMMKSSEVSCCSVCGHWNWFASQYLKIFPGFSLYGQANSYLSGMAILSWSFHCISIVKMSYLGNKHEDSQVYFSMVLMQLIQSKHEQSIWWVGWPIWWEIRSSLIYLLDQGFSSSALLTLWAVY